MKKVFAFFAITLCFTSAFASLSPEIMLSLESMNQDGVLIGVWILTALIAFQAFQLIRAAI
jgi:hypothetical protein